jgi:hypothetical protein
MTRELYSLRMLDKPLGKLNFCYPSEEASLRWLSASFLPSERTFSRLFLLFPCICNGPKDVTQVYCLQYLTDLGYNNKYLQCLSCRVWSSAAPE